MQIRDDWLDDNGVVRETTDNHGGVIEPEYLVIHYTAGSSARSSVDHFKDPQAQASAHVVIGREGEIYQLVPFNLKAWHAGASRWGDRNGLNSYSIGIELDNVGVLKKVGTQYRTWFERPVNENEVIEARHKLDPVAAFWQVYTEPQLAAAMEVAKAVIAQYGLKDIIGHDDIAPDRKRDPGPAFPMLEFRARLFGRREDAGPRLEITASLLNVRAAPDASARTVMNPLPNGTRVELVEMGSEWARVRLLDGTRREGWVRNTFVREPMEA